MTGTYALALVLAGLQGSPRDSLMAAAAQRAPMHPAEALVAFERILAADSADAEANWRAAIARSDLSLPLTARADRARRDSLLGAALEEARRAVRLAPAEARAQFALALVLGNTALTRGTRERVRMAVEIRAVALRALAADSTHGGAHHVLGRWNYEIMSLSGIQRFVARSLLGGGVFGQASWEEAQREMERAVALDSTRIYHRLDLARILVARKQTAAAREELRRIAAMPALVAADSTYHREARELLARIEPRP